MASRGASTALSLSLKVCRRLCAVICRVYPFLANLAEQQIGWARLQFEESQVIVGAIQELMGMSIPSYPVHDSLIVAKSTQRVAERVLEGFFLDSLGGRVILK